MKKNRIMLFLALSIGITYGLPAFADTGNYYKYKDDNGHTIISSTLPPEAANQGYQIVSPMGTIVETVDPKKSAEELNNEAILQKQKEAAEQESNKLREQEKAQAQKDDILLKSFSSAQDIERARNDKLASIQVLEQIMRESMIGLEKQLQDAKTAAVSYQTSNKPIPEKIQKTIQESERQIKENTTYLERKSLEKKEIHTKYQQLLDRFYALQPKKIEASPAAVTGSEKVESVPAVAK